MPHRFAVLEWTEPTPGLPLITSKSADADAIFDAVSLAIDALAQDDRAALGIKGLVRIAAQDYLDVPNPEGIDYGGVIFCGFLSGGFLVGMQHIHWN